MAEHKNSVYRGIYEDIVKKIESGEYKKGSMLEPERKLMAAYGVQRTTIRRALELLANEGYIVKKTGLGSFISDGTEKAPETSKVTVKMTEKKESAAKPKETAAVFDEAFDSEEERIQVLYDKAAKLLVKKLIEHGHERFCYVGNGPFFASLARAVFIYGLEYDRDLFAIEEDERRVYDAFRRLLSDRRRHEFTAVITSSETLAKTVLEVAKDYRVKVPEELSVLALLENGKSDIAGAVFGKMGEEAAKNRFSAGTTLEKIRKDASSRYVGISDYLL